jgi:hypothetical protein
MFDNAFFPLRVYMPFLHFSYYKLRLKKEEGPFQWVFDEEILAWTTKAWPLIDGLD